MRTARSFTISNVDAFKEGLLSWAQKFKEVAWLDSNGHHDRYSEFDALLAVDAHTSLVSDAQNAIINLKDYQAEIQDWIFGYLTYDIKNDIEHLSSDNTDELHFPELYFFQPKKIIRITGHSVDFMYVDMGFDAITLDLEDISNTAGANVLELPPFNNIRIKLRTFKDDYFNRVNEVLAHIHRGDIYEANFCQEFYAGQTEIDPFKTYAKLNSISKAPFATFLKIQQKYLLCASPERYLKKKGNQIISQPIKGTAKRSKNPSTDAALRAALQADVKERAENIMIVDLVRNDFSKSALRGSVTVEELCRVYTFEQVHQMISTVTAEVEEGKNPVEIIRDTFPMGSMTGAPKISAMQIIEQLEVFKRGLYSGATGYFTPNGDFDLNVVIRSILYNKDKKYVSFAVGSAITAKSVPEKEYEECLLKAKAMREVLGG